MKPWPDEARALLNILRASPDDTDTWNVFADWLTEQGDTRGELVRLEQRLQEPGLSADERSELQRRVDEWKKTHEETWLQGLLLPGATLTWRHGFVVGVRLPWNSDTLHIFAAMRAHPSGVLLHALDLGENNIGAEGARAIAASDTLRALTRLHLYGNDIGDEGKAALAASEHLRRCRVYT